MNKTFKVVFNKARGMLMVVNESTSSVQKKPGTTWLTAAVMATFMAAPAFAEDVVRTVIEEDTALVSSSASDVYYDVNVGTISKTERIGMNQSSTAVGSNEGNRIDLKANVDSLEIVSRENMDDLFQIGCIGLIKAIDNFDITQNVRFSTYAVPMILGEVKRYLRDNNSIRVSRSLRDTAYKAIYTRENLLKKQSKEPTLCEIAKELGVSKEEIAYALDAIQSPVSLYEPVYTDGGDPLYVMDQLSDKKNSEEHWVEDLSLGEAMQRLPDRERRIIDMRFFEGKTQTEVAEEIHISQAQVSRLEKSALKSMKHYLS